LAHWSLPGGGFFLWVTLVGEVDTAALLPRCAEAGVTYVPGAEFYPEHRPSPSLRLGFTTLARDDLVSGAERLGRVLRRLLAEARSR